MLVAIHWDGYHASCYTLGWLSLLYIGVVIMLAAIHWDGYHASCYTLGWLSC